MQSLLERLKRGLRDLGQTPRDLPRTQLDSAADRRDGDARPRRRTETDSSPRSGDSEPATKAPNGKLPQQRPALPASTRLKKAVLSKARRGSVPVQAASIWGVSPDASATAGAWFGASPPAQPPLFAGADRTADHDPNGLPASAHSGFFGAPAHQPPVQYEPSLWALPAALPFDPFDAAPPEPAPASPLFDGTPACARNEESAPPPDRLF